MHINVRVSPHRLRDLPCTDGHATELFVFFTPLGCGHKLVYQTVDLVSVYAERHIDLVFQEALLLNLHLADRPIGGELRGHLHTGPHFVDFMVCVFGC